MKEKVFKNRPITEGDMKNRTACVVHDGFKNVTKIDGLHLKEGKPLDIMQYFISYTRQNVSTDLVIRSFLIKNCMSLVQSSSRSVFYLLQ